ncbi:MAG TPA: hypothetical protein VFK05_34745 [Polyangiaceae bacterium]|nr:hypothetical protein [Polyangiaceae bacterium]
MRHSLLSWSFGSLFLVTAHAGAQTAVEPSRSSKPASAENDEARTDAREYAFRQERCSYGENLICFGLGRTVITGLFVEVEDARLNYRSEVMASTGLRGGWGVCARFGVDLWDWIPLHVGIRHASPNDDRGFSQDVVTCTQEIGSSQQMCDTTPHSAFTTAGGVLASAETGLEPNLRLARGWALSPGLLLGYSGALQQYKRSINDCVDCTDVSLPVDASAGYMAASLRLTWVAFGLALRYERYLGGDLKDGIAIAFDFGARYKAVLLPIPGEL